MSVSSKVVSLVLLSLLFPRALFAEQRVINNNPIVIGHFSFSVPSDWIPFSAADNATTRRSFSSSLAPGFIQYTKIGEPEPRMEGFEIFQKPNEGQIIGWTLILPKQKDFLKKTLNKENIQFQKQKNMAGGQIKSGSSRLYKVNGIDIVRVDVEMVNGGKSTNLQFWSSKNPRVITTLMIGLRPHKSVQSEKEFESILLSLVVSKEIKNSHKIYY